MEELGEAQSGEGPKEGGTQSGEGSKEIGSIKYVLPTKEEVQLYCNRFKKDVSPWYQTFMGMPPTLSHVLEDKPTVSRVEIMDYLNYKKTHPDSTVELLEYLGKK